MSLNWRVTYLHCHCGLRCVLRIFLVFLYCKCFPFQRFEFGRLTGAHQNQHRVDLCCVRCGRDSTLCYIVCSYSSAAKDQEVERRSGGNGSC
ncbi:hypothetical protein CERSUDRAFT_68638 [Gelatoporia subvermispora B]|uniref:Uncharacterized protein n=1 Tax=Ceriporiopsis subvermispora (strain B) TaxID=914234 RepID=M2R179_CERS8|nr:hypothetical protein CERSUDRAFT_68638 [Gelatoporia subvermispora B]